MVARFAPLALPQQLHDMPTEYQSKIPLFDGTPQIVSAQQHIDKMATFYDLYEIDDKDVTMRLFVKTFRGEVRKWFRGLGARSIPTLAELHKQFLNRWELRKDPLQINPEYNNIKHNPGDSVQDYIIRFNTVYNAIPNDLRPSRKSALLQFPDGFDPEMAYSLRDRDPPTLEDMKKIVVNVEENLNDKRACLKVEKIVTIKEESTSSEPPWLREMFKRLNLDKSEKHIRNPNYLGEQNHFFTPDDLPIYITEEDEYGESSGAQQDKDFILANDANLYDYQRGYLNPLSSQQKQYSLRNRDVSINPIQKIKEATTPKVDSSIPPKKGKETIDPTTSKISAAKRTNQPAIIKDRREVPVKEVKKVSALSLENEISKLKISIPLTEIMNSSYRGQVSKILNFDPMLDTVNVEDDQPELIFGLALDGQSPESDVPPFYISLRLHEYVLHNSMFDSGASHNLMPKEIMEKLGLDITGKYHDLYSFDSSRVRCIGLIKDLVVSLDQILVKNVLMDVVVADIPPRFGMLLSRS
eukprot:PITA_04872